MQLIVKKINKEQSILTKAMAGSKEITDLNIDYKRIAQYDE